MVTNNTVPECIARRIARAGSDKEIGACVAELQKVGVDPPKHIATLVQRVLLPKSGGVLRAVIRKVDLSDASDGTASLDLRKKTVGHLQLPEWCLGECDSIANELLGWLHTDGSIAAKPARVDRAGPLRQSTSRDYRAAKAGGGERTSGTPDTTP
jgi:hypothetical protein